MDIFNHLIAAADIILKMLFFKLIFKHRRFGDFLNDEYEDNILIVCNWFFVLFKRWYFKLKKKTNAFIHYYNTIGCHLSINNYIHALFNKKNNSQNNKECSWNICHSLELENADSYYKYNMLLFFGDCVTLEWFSSDVLMLHVN